MSKKELYVAPESEVLEVRLEGVIAASGQLNDWDEETPTGSWS